MATLMTKSSLVVDGLVLRTLHQLAQARLCAAVPDEWVSDWDKDHGSLERHERSDALLAQAIRGHWLVENKNHWKRDTSLWKEDASRPRKKASGGPVLALMRGAILRLHDLEAFESLNASSTATVPDRGPPQNSPPLIN
ncbi:MAG: hypothetical protein QNL33_11670 [Akkermansiaceae bacterium]